MSSDSNVSNIGLSTGSLLTRFIPEPKSRVGQAFSGVLNAVGGIVGAGASAAGIDSEYQQLINQQIEVQQQMQLVSFVSNVEKSKHETQMAAVRNLRAS